MAKNRVRPSPREFPPDAGDRRVMLYTELNQP
jgi:hypothetical protein